MSLLDNVTQEQAQVILAFAQKLTGLKIDAQFTKIEVGPVVTGYYFTLADSARVSSIFNKEEDFALAAKVESVQIIRIEGNIVVFVPNKERNFIDFKSILQWMATDLVIREMAMPICIGVDHLGNKKALDLTDQPHMLIAGQTGSGKSVFESAILCALSITKKPEDLHMYLVDTKGLDLPLFEHLPHVKRVVKNLDSFNNVMEFLMQETRDRMKKLEYAKVRNIREYNSEHNSYSKLPYILLMIDEMADLIDQDKLRRKGDKDYAKFTPSVPQWIKTLVQISRAAGVHVIGCTQRSSAKIVDGDIKANLPCRIALTLPTYDDSRTILGTGGAEKLLGRGDMLVQTPDADSPKRYHGPFVKLEDINQILEYREVITQQFDGQYALKLTEAMVK
jgi:S-DNA-T family DNA segregation ATPase FtsK/SpoIIIE